MATAECLARQGTPEQAVIHYGQAIDLWSGAPCSDLPKVAHGDDAQRIILTYLDAVENWAELSIATDDVAGTVARLRNVVSAHPFRERSRQLLMMAFYQLGRSAEATALYHEGRRTLAEELGVDPSPTIQELYRQILRGSVVIANRESMGRLVSGRHLNSTEAS